MTTHEISNETRSRRALLGGLLGGLAAWAAAAVGRVDPTAAAAGDPIRMGRLNKASSTATTLQTKTSGAAYQVTQIGGGAAVKGVATSGRAVMGVAGTNGTGVWGSSPNHFGVHGVSDAAIGVYGESAEGWAVQGWSYAGMAVYGESSTGIGVYGYSTTNYAGKFQGRTYTALYQDMNEMATPAAPPANMARTFVRDNGSGKTQLCVRFPTGDVQVIATEP
jgi:hypothetical protein